ncbi:molybdopterin-dependent oxidoreductase [Acidobacteria bacterium AH-259-O06]|nr:molybdopterin-dependent oxidoreductase [Acidobacteria bacterium AH-259-O06]
MRKRPAAADPPTLTTDALAALNRSGLSRRDFVKGAGVLIVGFSVARASRILASGPAAAQNLGVSGDQLDSWIAIGDDGRVTAYTGKCELGQGLYTAQTQLIAEELAVPFDHVTLIQCDTALTPDQGTTSGSQSHPANFNTSNLAQAGATAREALLRLAAERLQVPVEQLTVEDGVISVRTDPSRSVGYGALVGGKKFSLQLDSGAKRKHPSEWRVLGKAVPRSEIPALVAGRFEFVHNVRVPGMLHGRVVRPPVVGATLVSVDERSVGDLPGLVKVVVKNDFVGVVAEKPWQAIQAARKLACKWSSGVGLPSHGDFHEQLRHQSPTRDTLVVDSKDVDETLARAASVVSATYRYPYQMHGSVGSSCAVADVQGRKATIWSATQAVHPLRQTAAMILGVSPQEVRIIFKMGSGCYGFNGADTVSYDAALLSQAVGRAVRVQLTRRDEMAWENYGYAYVIDQRVGVDTQRRILAWDHEAWYPTLGSRPRSGTPGNVVTGFLAGFKPAVFTPRMPAPDPRGAYSNRSNAAPSYVAGCVGGRCGGTGTVKSERVLTHNARSPFFTGPLRSPSRLQNTFAHESVMDEVAAQVGADPVAFRLDHLSDARLIEVLKAVAQKANWDTRPSPRQGIARSGVATGRGIACVLYEGDNGYCALATQVEVDQDTGAVAVKRLVAGLDCGPISNPDGLRNQIEGGTLQGMSRALLEEVTWDEEKVTSVDWQTYASLPLGFEVPEMETILINRAEVEAMGAGETTITLAAAAIGNAIFDATGARIREVPFTRERVKEALASRAAQSSGG